MCQRHGESDGVFRDHRRVDAPHVGYQQIAGTYAGHRHTVFDARSQGCDPAQLPVVVNEFRGADVGVEADNDVRVGGRGNGCSPVFRGDNLRLGGGCCERGLPADPASVIRELEQYYLTRRAPLRPLAYRLWGLLHTQPGDDGGYRIGLIRTGVRRRSEGDRPDQGR